MSVAQEQRLPTPEDFVGLREVSDVRISPNGDLIAFVVTSEDEDNYSDDSDIWLVLSDGKMSARPFALSDYDESSPRWSPHGHYLAFLSDRNRDQKDQVYLLRIDGGEAQQITYQEEGVDEFKWSSDGSMIAFTSDGLWVLDVKDRFK